MANNRELIERVDAMRPNAFTDAQKLNWIGELDGKVALEVMLMSIEDAKQLEYAYPDGLEDEPMVRFPHQDIYEHYLSAKIDYWNGEYDRYQNAMQMFNAAWESFVCWFAGYYDPAQGYFRRDAYEKL